MSGPGLAVTAPDALARAVRIGLAALSVAAALSALAGLQLFGDGAYYYLVNVVDGEPMVPNFRFGAVLAQLPAMTMRGLTDDALLVRHAFAAGYAALPLLSLLACWLLVRRRAPGLVIFPVLSLLALQINFSGVSELIASLHFTWPVLLAAVLYPQTPSARAAAVLLGGLLLLLHPLAFLPALLVAAAGLTAARLADRAETLGRGRPRLEPRWRRVALWLVLTAAARALWTALGANAYERGVLEPESALSYLLPSTVPQQLLLGLILLLGLYAVRVQLRQAQGSAAAGMSMGCRLLLPLLALLAAAVAIEILLGHGVKLKAAVTFLLGLGLMTLAALVGLTRHLPGSARPDGGRGAAALVTACMAAVLVLTLAKSAAWWTATHALQNAVADTDAACLALGARTPYVLQWRWMRIVDDWAAPINALAFRPRGDYRPPIALLLPQDGCSVALRTGEVVLVPEIQRRLPLLDAYFGPLRAARDGRGQDR
ncbi:MAG: hypothetical protein K9M02_20375 [Thiohalocapsa sp.]|nr:hypothetical protein [Thiohalocapsa sp.]